MVERFMGSAMMSDVVALSVVAAGLAVAGTFYTILSIQTAFASSEATVEATEVEFAVEEAMD